MAKGIIYVMTTVVPGLIKIGKTGTENFENRMYQLERNGYFNVVGLKRRFAIEVDQYDEKEILVDEIFSKSRVLNSELFAIDADIVVQLLASFEGKQIYPKITTKEEVFIAAAVENQDKAYRSLIPNGEYCCEKTIKGFGPVTAKMRVIDGEFIVLKGSTCCPVKGDWAPEARRNAPIENNILLEDVSTASPSTAGWVVFGCSNNGWILWKDKDGKLIDTYRKNKEATE
ncbi:MAG: DUF4357 domain-containing protein [Bacteroidales bacterium]|nr:DUF4357 domain-containing protein [Bacteroidales bacterium]